MSIPYNGAADSASNIPICFIVRSKDIIFTEQSVILGLYAWDSAAQAF